MGRPKTSRNRPPPVSVHEASTAALAIVENRTTAGDSEAARLPAHQEYDDDELKEILRWCEDHPPKVLPKTGRQRELHARAVILAWLDQQAEREAQQRQRRLLRLLEDGHAARVPVPSYAEPLGLTSQNAWMLRNSLPTRVGSETTGSDYSRWLLDHRAQIADLGELLLANRDELIETLPHDERHTLAGFIDAAGNAVTRIPDLRYARTILAAVEYWRAHRLHSSTDPILAELDTRGSVLCASYTSAPEIG